MRPGSLLWSGQVIRGGDTSRYQFSGDNRVNLTFELDMVETLCMCVLDSHTIFLDSKRYQPYLCFLG